MPSPGDKFGPYEILSPIGAGGMGEVYKARDTRLDRIVAVKVLPSHIEKREDLRARFEREARAVASLNHPNICTLHDIGPGYMVMEFVDGATLAEKGAIPLDQALKHAAQIADALNRAHRAGVTHRDIKPGNIIVAKDGVKLLDFGLAKATPKTGPSEETLTAALTSEGTILGTPQYMAPEQFEGKEADARSDIWAFGAVLHEMITGQKAFTGKNYAGLVGAILSNDPAPLKPAWLDRIVKRCLQKDPDDRYQSMRDVVLDLQSPPQAETVQAKPSKLPWAIAAAALAIAIAAFVFRPAPATSIVTRFDIAPPEGTRIPTATNAAGIAISPDGKIVAFVADNEKLGAVLYIRRIDSLSAVALPGTEGAGRPFWSPDSKSIAFGAAGKLKRIEITGGTPIVLGDLSAPRGGSWGDDGQIFFAERTAGIRRVAAAGGAIETVRPIDQTAGTDALYYPQILPGGKTLLYYLRNNEGSKSGIYSAPTGDGAAVQVLPSSFNAIYDAASRHLLHVQGGGILTARRMEMDPPRLTGDPIVIAEGIGGSGQNSYAAFSISTEGTLVYKRGAALRKRYLTWRDRDGKILHRIANPIEGGGELRTSPDGSKAAITIARGLGAPDIWIADLSNGQITRLTFDGGFAAAWSPDGKYIYYARRGAVARKPVDGAGEAETVATGIGTLQSMEISRDGKYLLYGIADILMLPLTGEPKPVPYLKTPFAEGNARVSPDGSLVAYNSDESGRSEVYIQGFPERRGKWMVSMGGGGSPQWRADGKELFWRELNGVGIVSATIERSAAGIKTGKPERRFRAEGEASATNFQTSVDGKPFLFLDPDGEGADLPLTIVQNWRALLPK